MNTLPELSNTTRPPEITGPMLPRLLADAPREKIAAAVRAFVLLTVAIMARFQSPAPADSLQWVFLAGVLYVLATTFAPLVRLSSERLTVVMLVIDIGLISALIYSTGGVRSEYYVLYYLPILNAALRLDFRDAIGASALAAASYVLAVAMRISEGESAPNFLPRAITFGSSSILLAGFFAYICRESRTYQQLTHWYKKANDQKAEFVSIASHELRTPLTSIMGFSDLLCYSDCDLERQQEYLKIIKSQSDRLARLIENILEMSRIEAGRIKLKPAPVKLPEVVSRALMTTEGVNGNVRVSFPSDLPTACADMNRVEQILKVFLANAISYCPEGPIEVSASLEPEFNEAVSHLRVAVKDHGPGIPVEDLPHIFDMFYSATNAAGRQGTGLSLAIAKRMAEMQQGEVWAESRPGEGATFFLRLPVWQEAGAESEPEIEIVGTRPAGIS